MPITVTTSPGSGTQILVGTTSDTNYVTSSPYTVALEASCTVSTTSCKEIQTFIVTFTNPATVDPCLSAPLAISDTGDTNSVTMTVTDPLKKITMDTFSYNIGSYPGCYTFTTYEVDLVKTPM